MPLLDESEKAFFDESAFAVPVTLNKGGTSYPTSGIPEEAVFEDDSDHDRASRNSIHPQLTVPTSDLPAGFTEGDSATYEYKGETKTRIVLDVLSDETQATITFEE